VTRDKPTQSTHRAKQPKRNTVSDRLHENLVAKSWLSFSMSSISRWFRNANLTQAPPKPQHAMPIQVL
jgi:hypothetical protein